MSLLLFSGSQGVTPHPRPPAVKQPPLPPFDASDPGGDVHTSAPPEWQPPSKPDRLWPRADFGGITLPTAPPRVPGCNTTPPEMVMTFLLPWYVQFGSKWVDAILTASAERSYDTIHLDRLEADKSGLSLSQQLDLIATCVSWGNHVSFWATSSGEPRSNYASVAAKVEPFLDGIAARGLADKVVCLVGEELDNGTPTGPDNLDDLITGVARRCNQYGIPAVLHFSANKPAWPAPGVPFDQWWARWAPGQPVSLAGHWWQGDPNDPAGTSGARMWDCRRILSAASPDFTFTPFEYMAERQLFGQATEAQGCLRGLELSWCPIAPGSGVPANSGFGNGGRLPDGTAI